MISSRSDLLGLFLLGECAFRFGDKEFYPVRSLTSIHWEISEIKFALIWLFNRLVFSNKTILEDDDDEKPEEDSSKDEL